MMNPYKKAMYLNALRVILSKENYKKVKKMEDEEIERIIKTYHRVKSKEKINEIVKNMDEKSIIDEAIELHKRAIEKLERIKKGLLIV